MHVCIMHICLHAFSILKAFLKGKEKKGPENYFIYIKNSDLKNIYYHNGHDSNNSVLIIFTIMIIILK